MTETRKEFMLVCETSGQTIAKHVEIALGTFDRMRGLIGRREFPLGNGLFIPRCRCIHTFFMAFPIDILFVNAENEIVKKAEMVEPWRFAGAARARHVIELPGGTLAGVGCPIGARVALTNG